MRAGDPEQLLNTVRDRIGIAPTMWLLGHKHLAENRAPPVYIWYPDIIEDAPSESAGGQVPQASTCLLGFIVRIWGVNLYDTFARYIQLRTALFIEADTSVIIQRGKWARSGQLALGEGIEVPIVFKVPVPAELIDVELVQAEKDEFELTGATSGDSWIEPGDT